MQHGTGRLCLCRAAMWPSMFASLPHPPLRPSLRLFTAPNPCPIRLPLGSRPCCAVRLLGCLSSSSATHASPTGRTDPSAQRLCRTSCPSAGESRPERDLPLPPQTRQSLSAPSRWRARGLVRSEQRGKVLAALHELRLPEHRCSGAHSVVSRRMCSSLPCEQRRPSLARTARHPSHPSRARHPRRRLAVPCSAFYLWRTPRGRLADAACQALCVGESLLRRREWAIAAHRRPCSWPSIHAWVLRPAPSGESSASTRRNKQRSGASPAAAPCTVAEDVGQRSRRLRVRPAHETADRLGSRQPQSTTLGKLAVSGTAAARPRRHEAASTRGPALEGRAATMAASAAACSNSGRPCAFFVSCIWQTQMLCWVRCSLRLRQRWSWPRWVRPSIGMAAARCKGARSALLACGARAGAELSLAGRAAALRPPAAERRRAAPAGGVPCFVLLSSSPPPCASKLPRLCPALLAVALLLSPTFPPVPSLPSLLSTSPAAPLILPPSLTLALAPPSLPEQNSPCSLAEPHTTARPKRP
jgi:hypothetical protein